MKKIIQLTFKENLVTSSTKQYQKRLLGKLTYFVMLDKMYPFKISNKWIVIVLKKNIYYVNWCNNRESLLDFFSS